jgi:hypothetical protein
MVLAESGLAKFGHPSLISRGGHSPNRGVPGELLGKTPDELIRFPKHIGLMTPGRKFHF